MRQPPLQQRIECTTVRIGQHRAVMGPDLAAEHMAEQKPRVQPGGIDFRAGQALGGGAEGGFDGRVGRPVGGWGHVRVASRSASSSEISASRISSSASPVMTLSIL